MTEYIPVLFVLAITAVTVWLGIYATRQSQTASDFFVAGRSVSVFWNASAISGEYLSAASFMGIAGLLMKNGYDVLWYPVGYATGYLFLLLFIAGPLRRFGAYTIPDFAEGRFDSPLFRKIAVTFVLLIGFFYTMPQMKAAGVTMNAILGWPYWAGIAVVGTVITFNVALGGMKGITFVQAFQYWAKMFAIAAPVFVLMNVFGGYHTRLGENASAPGDAPRVAQDTTLKFKGAASAPANAVSFSTLGDTRMSFPNGAKIDKVSPVRKAEPGEDRMPREAGSTLPDRANQPVHSLGEWNPNSGVPPRAGIIARPFTVTKNSEPVLKDGKPVKTAPKIEFAEPTTAVLPAGSYVPNAPTNKKWLEPFGPLTSKHGYPLLYTYSLIIALVCGTAGLPHILVRFYTNPDGRAAKRTTFWVMVLLGVFYVFTPIWGVLGRSVLPALYANNATDSVVIKLPTALSSPVLGQVLAGITSAGAFAAFMSTFSGLLVSMSGALAHDIYGRMLRPQSSGAERLRAFKVAAVACGVVSMLLGYLVETFDIAMMVGWAFAIGAASYFPLLLLGSWWRGLTKYGAAAGMLLGGTLSLLAIVGSMLLDKKILALDVSPLTRSLMEQPAIWGVPLALGVMVVVSRLTARHVPGDVDVKMLRLHAPEEMGFSKNYIEH
jgi:Na+(H+)/acetate symporter ActP